MNRNEGGGRHLSGKFPKKRQAKAPASEDVYKRQLSQWRFFLFTAAGQLHSPNKIDLGCTCPLFESNSSRDASGNTGQMCLRDRADDLTQEAKSKRIREFLIFALHL